MPYILFDIGANYGTNSIARVGQDDNMICFAFEPTPNLVNFLKDQTINFSDRYLVYPYAISNFIGQAVFNIAGQGDWGCSSLLEFSENLEHTWPGRQDFKVTSSINVDVITLAKFIEDICPIQLEKIDYLHCDTQGSDLDVLIGMGRYIDLVIAGNIEVASNENVSLYKNQSNMKNKAIDFLTQNSFDILDISPNDPLNNEYNIFFKKRS